MLKLRRINISMMRNFLINPQLIIGLFICLLIEQHKQDYHSVTCLNDALNVFEPKVTIKLEKFIRAFDDQSMIPVEPDVKYFFPIGQFKLFGTNLSEPYFYPAKFNIYTRESKLEGIMINSMRHRIVVKNTTSGLEKNKIRRYEFNLTELVGPNNPFSIDRRTIILIPGYLDDNNNSDPDWLAVAVRNLLELSDVNVIVVDWLTNGNLQSDSYDTIVANTRVIGRQITMLLYYLTVIRDVDFVEDFKFRETISIVGHSIGCHIGSFVAFELRGKIDRLTCLDPAGPIFDTFEWENRLNLNLANFVDVIHTNSGQMEYIGERKDNSSQGYFLNNNLSEKNHILNSILNSHKSHNNGIIRLGMDSKLHKLAHMSYIVSGGSNQPGCSSSNTNHDHPVPMNLCDHQRVTSIYNSILEYELKYRIAYGPESEIIKRGLHRLVAFPSPNYDTFKSGFSLVRNCPALVRSNNVDLSSKDRYENFKRCMIPIDLIKSGKEIRRELEEEFSYDFGEQNYNPNYNYFETLSMEPFVSEHYLLRVHMPRQSKIDSDNQLLAGCKLKILAQSKQNRDLFAQMMFEADLMEFEDENQFYGLALPFVNPVDWRIEQTTPFVVKEFLRDSDNNIELFKRFESILPETFSISLNNQDNNKSGLCKLTINNLEARPLNGIVYNISSWYSNDSNSFEQSVIEYKKAIEFMKTNHQKLVEMYNTKNQTTIMNLVLVGYDHNLVLNNTQFNE